jgi:hypothetical protein
VSEYEWGVVRDGDSAEDLHRGPWTEQECRGWIGETRQVADERYGLWAIARASRPLFRLVRRPVGDWEFVEDLR